MKEQEVNGFSKHYWDGITTLELSKIIYEIIIRDNKLKGIVDLRSREKVSKYELLKKINHIFNRKIEINKKETEIIDKTNNNPNILSNLSLNEQIIELKLWMQEHQKNYEKYKI
jgi:dTDP-4-dehydrorhamnose reductase